MQLLQYVKNSFLALLILFTGVIIAGDKKKADLIVINAKVYTVDSVFSIAESFAVSNGCILDVGDSKKILNAFHSNNIIDAKGKYIYPGFIDGHCHFYYYGLTLGQVDLTKTKSFDDVLHRIKIWAKENSTGWIIGRGWDQNEWTDKSFPVNDELNKLFPDRPVMLSRIDGHAALVNNKALEISGLNENLHIQGGNIILNKKGKPTGMLIDNAYEHLYKLIPPLTLDKKIAALKDAQVQCFKVGLTTVDEAGLDKETILLIDSLHKSGTLKMRVYAMVSDRKENLDYFFDKGIYKSQRLNVRSIKVFADGSLGSRGACLLKPYTDKPDQHGFLLNDPEHFTQVAENAFKYGFQMNTHCIGDSSTRMIARLYKKILKGENDRRWRMEHAQLMLDEDIKILSENNVIPSVQPSHATSDMTWVKERIGAERMSEAYAYKKLLDACGMLCIGSDFPVEGINPVMQYYAAISRKNSFGEPEKGFLPDQKINRQEALKGITVWAAYANFEEKEKGSIEKGKVADFVISDTDLLNASESQILKTKIISTFIQGEKVTQD